jgi:hypothetical protein
VETILRQQLLLLQVFTKFPENYRKLQQQNH